MPIDDQHSSRIQKTAALIWLLVFLLCCVTLFNQLQTESPDQASRFNTSILALLPASEQSPLVEVVSANLAQTFSNRVVLLIGVRKSSKQATALAQASQNFAHELQQSGVFSAVSSHLNISTLTQQKELYFPFRYQLLSQGDRQSLLNNDIAWLTQRAKRQLFSPATEPRQASLIDDPLNIFSHWLFKDKNTSNIQVDEYGLTLENEDFVYRLILCEFTGNSFNFDRQNEITQAIHAAETNLIKFAHDKLEQPSDDFDLIHSGLVFHAAEGAAQAKSEISTIGLGSLLGIIVLLLWNFRSATPFILAVFAIGCGLVVALTISLLIFDQVHMITLAFGASLVGVSIDYALHYLCAQKQLKSDTIKHILPALSLGLISSALAYGAQLLTPFPGLKQMAVFSVSGLLGSWLTVICILPILSRSTNQSTSTIGFIAQGLQPYKTAIRVFLLGLIAISAVGVFSIKFEDDIRLLNTSSVELISQEQQAQKLLNNASTNQFFLIQAATAESLLQTEEALRPSLDAMIDEGKLLAYQSLSQQVPSIQRQTGNRALLEQLFYSNDRQPQDFFKSLGAPDGIHQQSVARFNNNNFSPLGLQQYLDSTAAEYNTHLWHGHFATHPNHSDIQAASIITLSGVTDPAIYNDMKALSRQYDAVIFVDRVDELSSLLERYRLKLGQWMMCIYVIILAILWRRYGQHALIIIGAPILATFITFTVISLLGVSLNLFHLLASLLVLGIGLDVGIFLRESRHSTHAWEAITLSALTTLLAFGLLSLSKTPVLHHFGMTVLPGIALCWLLAFAVAPNSPTDTPSPDK